MGIVDLDEIMELWPAAADRLHAVGGMPDKRVESPLVLCGGQLLWIFDHDRAIHDEKTCLTCGQPMDASRKGETHFFRHKSKELCSGTFFSETLPHLMAKEVIRLSRRISVPALKEVGIFHPDIEEYAFQTGPIPYERVEIEKTVKAKVGYFRPDARIWSGGREILVEIVVTHDISDETRDLMEVQGHTVLRIDLKGITESGRKKMDSAELDALVRCGVIDANRNTQLWGAEFEAYVLSGADRGWPIQNLPDVRERVTQREIAWEKELTKAAIESQQAACRDLEARISDLSGKVSAVETATAGWPPDHLDRIVAAEQKLEGISIDSIDPWGAASFKALKDAAGEIRGLDDRFRDPKDCLWLITSEAETSATWLRSRRDKIEAIVAAVPQGLEEINRYRVHLDQSVSVPLKAVGHVEAKIAEKDVYLASLVRIGARIGPDVSLDDLVKKATTIRKVTTDAVPQATAKVLLFPTPGAIGEGAGMRDLPWATTVYDPAFRAGDTLLGGAATLDEAAEVHNWMKLEIIRRCNRQPPDLVDIWNIRIGKDRVPLYEVLRHANAKTLIGMAFDDYLDQIMNGEIAWKELIYDLPASGMDRDFPICDNEEGVNQGS